MLLSIPVIWMITEYLRAWIFSIVTWGKGALLGPFWTFSHLGYILADTPIFYLSRSIGLYGLSFIVAMMNVIIFLLIKNGKLKIIILLLMIFFGVSYFYVHLFSKENHIDSQSSIKVMLLSIPASDASFYREGFLKILDDEKITSDNQPNIVLFPEGLSFLSLYGELERPVLEKIFPNQERNGYVIANKMSFTERGRISEIVYRDQKGNLIKRQEKNFLIPAGEVLPLGLKIFSKIIHAENNIKSFSANRELASGAGNKAVSLGKMKIGAFLCSELLSPLFSRLLVNDGAQIIFNSSSHSLWRGNQRLDRELELMARFVAMSNKRYFLQSTFDGPIYAINTRGFIFQKFFGQLPSISLVAAGLENSKTLTTRTGDTPIILSGLLVLVIFIYHSRRFRSLDPK
ncbi:MAG: nitrilase-related carbon-nitrogen hydrolase [Patescibacteria group bacterium]